MNNTKRIIVLLLAVATAIFISNMTPPHEALGPASMRFLGIFAAFLIVLIFQAMEDWVASLFAMAAMIVCNVATLNKVIEPMAQSTIWLMVGVLAMAAALGSSGLLRRIAMKILTWFPSTYRGMVMAMMTSGLAVTPFVSSVMGKGTLMAPIATNVSELAGFKEGSRPALGMFSAVFFTAYCAGNAFLTGSAYPAIILGMSSFNITWIEWFIASSVFLVVIVLGGYVFCMTYCKPRKGEELERIDSSMFREKYAELGPISNNEKFAALVLALAFLGWLTQQWHGVDAGTIAILAVVAFGIYGLFTSKDFVTKTPWTLIVFVGGLLSVAGLLSSLGVNEWIAAVLGPVLAPILSSPWIFIPVLCIIVYLLRFVIISITATLAIMLAIFGPLMGDAGISMFVLLFTTTVCSNIWSVKYQASIILPVWAAGGGKMVPFEMFSKASLAYMVICFIACTASIPLWQMIGFIQ